MVVLLLYELEQVVVLRRNCDEVFKETLGCATIPIRKFSTFEIRGSHGGEALTCTLTPSSTLHLTNSAVNRHLKYREILVYCSRRRCESN
jgi:hypothetical protein